MLFGRAECEVCGLMSSLDWFDIVCLFASREPADVGGLDDDATAIGLSEGVSALLLDLASSAAFFFSSASFLVPGKTPKGLSIE